MTIVPDGGAFHDDGQRDARRYHDRVRKAIAERLRERIGEERLITAGPEHRVRVPVKGTREYRFILDRGLAGGVGQGDAEGRRRARPGAAAGQPRRAGRGGQRARHGGVRGVARPRGGRGDPVRAARPAPAAAARGAAAGDRVHRVERDRARRPAARQEGDGAREPAAQRRPRRGAHRRLRARRPALPHVPRAPAPEDARRRLHADGRLGLHGRLREAGRAPLLLVERALPASPLHRRRARLRRPPRRRAGVHGGRVLHARRVRRHVRVERLRPDAGAAAAPLLRRGVERLRAVRLGRRQPDVGQPEAAEGAGRADARHEPRRLPPDRPLGALHLGRPAPARPALGLRDRAASSRRGCAATRRSGTPLKTIFAPEPEELAS